jgi:AbrB family looped-hinge helix DNA binding protein
MVEEVTVMSVRGQVVIPQQIRKRMKLRPKDRLVVYGEEDTIIMKKLELPELKQTFAKIGRIMRERNRRDRKLTEKDVQKEVAQHRKEK